MEKFFFSTFKSFFFEYFNIKMHNNLYLRKSKCTGTCTVCTWNNLPLYIVRRINTTEPREKHNIIFSNHKKMFTALPGLGLVKAI